MTINDRYAKIREVLDMNPTPGPWDGDGYSVSRLWSNGTAHLREYIALPDTTDDHEPNPADMRFIAACDPDTLRELLDERDALAAENKKLRETGDPAFIHALDTLAERDREIEELKEALEHVTGLLVDTWNTKMEGDPERQVAVRDARAALKGASDG